MCWQSSIYLRAVWRQFLCHSYMFSVWIAGCHRTASACCLHGVQAAVTTFGVNVTALLVQRDLPSIMRGWRIPLMALLLKIYFCTWSALNEKGWSPEVYLYGMLSVCEFVICSFILNVCKFIFLLGDSSASPWCFAVVSWEDRRWDHFPVVSGCFWYSSASSFCCPVSSFFLMLSFAVLYSVPLLSCF